MKKTGVLATMFWSGCVGTFLFCAIATSLAGVTYFMSSSWRFDEALRLVVLSSAAGFAVGVLAGAFGGAAGWGASSFVIAFFIVIIMSDETIVALLYACIFGILGGFLGAWIHSPLVPWRFLDPFKELEKNSVLAMWPQGKRNRFVLAPLALYAMFRCSTMGASWLYQFRSNTRYLARYGYVTTLRQSYRLARIGYMRGYAPRASCQSNLKQIGLGMMQYIQDYDEFYPPVAVNSAQTAGWADAIQPYLKTTHVYQCPNEFLGDASVKPRATGYTDYWYNSRFSSLNQSSLTATALTIINGDGNDGFDVTDARYSLSASPPAWIANSHSPLYRHLNGANYAFADGHVRWLVPGKIGIAATKSGGYTFATQ